MKSQVNHTVCAKLPMAIGVGLIAGLAGTIVMTACPAPRHENYGTKRKYHTGRCGAGSARYQARYQMGKPSDICQGSWGLWNVARARSRFDSSPWNKGTYSGCGPLWRGLGNGTDPAPQVEGAPPVNKESPGTIARDALYHVVYAGSAGLVFDAVMEEAQAGQVREHFIIQSKKN